MSKIDIIKLKQVISYILPKIITGLSQFIAYENVKSEPEKLLLLKIVTRKGDNQFRSPNTFINLDYAISVSMRIL